MNTDSTPEDSKAPRSSRFSLIAIVLILVAFVGAYVSACYSHTLSGLLQEQREFNELFGAMDIEDPSQVAIVAVSPTASDLPPWMDPERVWIYRVQIPANYAVAWSENEGLIAADSPLRRGNNGGSYSYQGSEAPKEVRIVITTNIEDGRLKGTMLTNSGSLSFSLPKEMALASPDDLILDEVVKPGDPMRTFAVDEAICVWRIRSKKPSKKKRNHTQLYPGCAIYLYETSRRDAFERWANGKASSMGKSTL